VKCPKSAGKASGRNTPFVTASLTVQRAGRSGPEWIPPGNPLEGVKHLVGGVKHLVWHLVCKAVGGGVAWVRRNRVRRAVKTVVAGLLHRSGLRSAVARVERARAGGRRVHIVAYHRVVEDFERERTRCIPGMVISARTFASQLEGARAAGFDFATLGDALAVLDGSHTPPRDLFVVTFDDGYLDVVEHALPVLQRMSVPATMYLATEAVGTNRRFDHDRLWHLLHAVRSHALQPAAVANLSPPASELLQAALEMPERTAQLLDQFIGRHPAETLRQVIGALESLLPEEDRLPSWGRVMSWADVGTWMSAGMDVGTHTLDHRVLTHEPLDVLEAHLGPPRQALEAAVGRPVRDFAYCNGWYSEALIEALRRSGYRSAVTTEALPNTVGIDPFRLRRRVLNEGFSLGLGDRYSEAVTACQVDDTFGALGFTRPVLGHTTQAAE
jgi:peptidoglycan/xylan/chitin deacetylase (PgdA/CDA1 family)